MHLCIQPCIIHTELPLLTLLLFGLKTRVPQRTKAPCWATRTVILSSPPEPVEGSLLAYSTYMSYKEEISQPLMADQSYGITSPGTLRQYVGDSYICCYFSHSTMCSMSFMWYCMLLFASPYSLCSRLCFASLLCQRRSLGSTVGTASI